MSAADDSNFLGLITLAAAYMPQQTLDSYYTQNPPVSGSSAQISAALSMVDSLARIQFKAADAISYAGYSSYFISNYRQKTNNLTSTSRKNIVTALIQFYESQRQSDMAYGYRNLPRASLPVAADIPTITAITGLPSADADAAAKVYYPFGLNDTSTGLNSDPIPPSRASNKAWVRGHNEFLRPRAGYGVSLRLSQGLGAYQTNGNQDRDPVTQYGINFNSSIQYDIILTGDVVFLGGAAGSTFEVEINESLLTTAPGSGLTFSNGRQYTITAHGYVKIKFATKSDRRILLRPQSVQSFGSMWVRNVDTLQPALTNPITWLALGDSFSQNSGASYPSLGFTTWLNAAYGNNINYINCSQGGSSLAGTTADLPNQTPTVGHLASIRKQYLLAGINQNPDVISMLGFINDSGSDFNKFAVEFEALIKDTQTRWSIPPIVFVHGCNANPSGVTSGVNAQVENIMASICAKYPGVFFFPQQTDANGAFLTGTGNNTAPAGDGNADELVSFDATHPSDKGHKVLGLRMARRQVEALKKSQL